MKALLSLAVFAVLSGCVASTHAVQKSALGTTSSSTRLLEVLDTPGPIEVETVVSADWKVTRAGLINLEHPKAKEAGLKDELEPVQVFFHVLKHPTFGTFIIDTGVEKAQRDRPEKAAIRGLLENAFHLDELKIHMPLGDWLASHPGLKGVFLTHLHTDHAWGMSDVPVGTPIYTGPGDAAETRLLNAFTQPSIDRMLAGQAPLSEWNFSSDSGAMFEGVIDVFGDGSLFAIWVPGHTPGSTAFVARTATGSVLFTGDVAHTAWGWVNGVESGSFTGDQPRSIESLRKLREFSKAHPAMKVLIGHQRLP